MSVDENKRTVERFFHCLDTGDQTALRALFVDGARRHFPGRTITMHSAGPLPPSINSTAFRTEIHHLFGEGELVAARITHHVTFGDSAQWSSQAGSFPADGKSVRWGAAVVFRFEGDKIAEEWVNRDELAVLRQIGAFP
jgi:ketosteroid isomerase-like protein